MQRLVIVLKLRHLIQSLNVNSTSEIGNFDIFSIVNFIVSISSISLAIVAIIQAINSTRESRKNYEKTKDVLAEINTKSAVIEATVQKSQEKLMATVTKIIDEIVIPKKDDPRGRMFLDLMANNPQMQQMAQERMKHKKF